MTLHPRLRPGRARLALAILVLTALSSVTPLLNAGVTVIDLGRLSPGLSAEDDHQGTERKWAKLREKLGADADRVLIKQLGADLGGNTSVRNSSPLTWKEAGYYQRARDLGQVFTAPSDFILEALVLRTGNAPLAFLAGATGAEVFVQLFEVVGTPVIDDNGTPPGRDATHGFSKNHRCDDFVIGVEYRPLHLVRGGRLPDLTAGSDGRLTYMKWEFDGPDRLRFEQGKRYAFMVGFVEPGSDRNFTLANRNNASSPLPPAMSDRDDTYGGGWGLRREGNGQTPPRMIPGSHPPADAPLLRQLQTEATFPPGEARYAISPTCDGYPDVDTYRDLEFYLIEGNPAAAPRLDPRTSTIQALNQALAEREDAYDPAERMVLSKFSSPGYHTTLKAGRVHRTRDSLTYAAGCLDSGDPGLKQRGFDIIDRVIQLQDTDPTSKTYGIWSWFLEEPLGQMAPPDWNWADFCGVQLLQAVLYHRHEFPPALLQRVEQSIHHAAQSIRRRNVGPGYTNIAIMGTYVTMMAAELLELPDLQEYARQRLKRFYDYTLRTGSFQEYNSPTYTVVALEELGRMRQHFTDPRAKTLVDDLYRIAWEEIAIHFHPPTRQWGGPHSRSYSTLLRDGTLSFLQSQTSDSIRFEGIGASADLEARRLQCPCPEDLEPYFLQLETPRHVIRSYSTGERPVVGTTYLHPNFCLGTVNRGDLWNQRRALVAYWGRSGSPSYLNVRFLHDGYDFSAAEFFSAQDAGNALFGTVLATDGGDTHVSLDRIRDGQFRASDLRLRFELGGEAAAGPVQGWSPSGPQVELVFPTLTVKLTVPFASFGDHPIRWESGQANGTSFYDVVFYEGAERSFDLETIDRAAVAAAVALETEVNSPANPIRTALERDRLVLEWNGLALKFPTRPATRTALQGAAE